METQLFRRNHFARRRVPDDVRAVFVGWERRYAHYCVYKLFTSGKLIPAFALLTGAPLPHAVHGALKQRVAQLPREHRNLPAVVRIVSDQVA